MKAAELNPKTFHAWADEDGKSVVVIGSKNADVGVVEAKESAWWRRCRLATAMAMLLLTTLAAGFFFGALLGPARASETKQQSFLAPLTAPTTPAPRPTVEERVQPPKSIEFTPTVQGVLSLSVTNASAFLSDRAKSAIRATIASTSHRLRPDMVEVNHVRLARRLSLNSSILQQLQVDYTILVPEEEDAKVIAEELLVVPIEALTSQLATDMEAMGLAGSVEVTNVKSNVFAVSAPAGEVAQDEVELTVLPIQVPRPAEEPEPAGEEASNGIVHGSIVFRNDEEDRKEGMDHGKNRSQDDKDDASKKDGENLSLERDVSQHGTEMHGNGSKQNSYDKDGWDRGMDGKSYSYEEAGRDRGSDHAHGKDGWEHGKQARDEDGLVDSNRSEGKDGKNRTKGKKGRNQTEDHKGGKMDQKDEAGRDSGNDRNHGKDGWEHGEQARDEDGLVDSNRSDGQDGKNRTKGKKGRNQTEDHKGGKMDQKDEAGRDRGKDRDHGEDGWEHGKQARDEDGLVDSNRSEGQDGTEIRSTGLGLVAETPVQHAVLQVVSSVHRLLADATNQADMLGGIVRLAVHDAMTWDVVSSTGGADGCVDLEAAENKGLESVISDLESVVQSAAGDLSRADIWILAANVAIEYAGGPKLDFEAGRIDANSCAGFADRLPDAEQGHLQIEQTFVQQLKFSAREVTALMGAHVLGRAEPLNSGYSGSWVPRNDRFTNAYFDDLLNVRWHRQSLPSFGGKARTQWNGRRNTMMLNTDIELAFDISAGCMQAGRREGCPRAQHDFSTAVSEFATQQGERAFFETFAGAWKKLTALGSSPLSCPFEDCSLPSTAFGSENSRQSQGQSPNAPGNQGGGRGAQRR
eukprot:TRINITY_DN556_c0_g1_i1.p1 TRINITY_DN556_c0_g1~~TRINITY_DN556_c0_g1_i1.p1  ORF type:complete len:860 (+),score=217.26 TRINITY_DN556_c0_g1_i1:58-2637(+)